ncbi:protein kinase [bacterium]|nr:protein kinase [candidate division CSSED10-310 bacterium]
MYPDWRSTWEPGQMVIIGYRVIRTLGRGGSGTVYLIEHEMDASRRYAAKILNVGERRRSFGKLIREVRMWIDLPEHPNITACRFFRTIDGRFTVFAEYVSGGSLRTWIDNCRLLDIGRILDVAIQLAWGLEAAHRAHLAHQDVKPSNVLMTDGGDPKLTDFGLAGCREPGRPLSVENLDGRTVMLTSRGMTPAYCSPEQASGARVSRKSDVWSFGLTILEMFTGPGTWQFGFTAPMILHQVLEGGLYKPYPALPDRIGKILAKCFEIKPDDRWQSMGDLAEALRDAYEILLKKRFERIQPEFKPPEPSPARFDRMHIHGSGWRAPVEWMNLIRESGGIVPAGIEHIIGEQKGSYRVRLLTDLELYEELDEPFETLVTGKRRDLVMEYRQFLYEKILILDSFEDNHGARELNRKIIRLLEQHRKEKPESATVKILVQAHSQSAVTSYKVGDTDEALEHLDQAIRLLQSIPASEDYPTAEIEMGQICQNKGVMLGAQARYTEAEQMLLKSIQIMKPQLNSVHSSRALGVLLISYQNAAHMYSLIHRHAEANELLRKALELTRNNLRNISGKIRNLEIHSTYAFSLYQAGSSEEALLYFERAETILNGIKGEIGEINVLRHLGNIEANRSMVYYSSGELKKALKSIDTALSAYHSLVVLHGLEERSQDLSVVFRRKAMILHDLNRPEAVIECCDEADRILDSRMLNSRNPSLMNELAHRAFYRGYALMRLGETTRAYREFTEGEKWYGRFRDECSQEADDFVFKTFIAFRTVAGRLSGNKADEDDRIREHLAYFRKQYRETGAGYVQNYIRDIQTFLKKERGKTA